MNYKLSISKSKNARIFYIQTSYRKGAKVCTKTVKKLGNETFIKETYGVEDAEMKSESFEPGWRMRLQTIRNR